MIDWRKLYMTYQTLNLSQAVDIFVNSNEEELKTAPRSEQNRVKEQRAAARTAILQALHGHSFRHGRVGNKYIDTGSDFIIIERESFLEWCLKIGVSLNGFIKQSEMIQNITDRESSHRSISIEDDMPVTLQAVISAWNEFGPEIKNQKIGEIESWIKSRFAGLTNQKYIECAQVVTGGRKSGRAPKSQVQARNAKEAWLK